LSLSSFIFLSVFVACCELGGSRSNRCRKLHYLVLKTQQDLHLNNMSTTQNTREGCRSRPAASEAATDEDPAILVGDESDVGASVVISVVVPGVVEGCFSALLRWPASLALQPCSIDPSVETRLSLALSRSRAMGLLVLKKLT